MNKGKLEHNLVPESHSKLLRFISDAEVRYGFKPSLDFLD